MLYNLHIVIKTSMVSEFGLDLVDSACVDSPSKGLAEHFPCQRFVFVIVLLMYTRRFPFLGSHLQSLTDFLTSCVCIL